MKRKISLFLALCLVLTAACLPAYASKDDNVTDYPVIMVAGYSASALVLEKEDGSEEQVWQMQGGNIFSTVFGYVGRIIAGLGLAVLEKPGYLAGIIGNGAKDLVGMLACNDDGTSKYNVHPMFSGAEECNCQNMLDRFGDESYQHETDIMGAVREYVDRSNTYDFNCDFRMGAVENAKKLDEFIQDVKRYSGKDKVNILAVSHGGQVTGTYLTLFGHKRDVNNCVMTVPALGGAGILYDLLGETTDFDELNLLYFIEHGSRLETDFHWLVEAEELGFLDGLITELFPYFMDIIGNWGSIWDFVPTDAYEAMKAKWLDPVANAAIIEKSDYMHYTVMPKFWSAFRDCNEKYGMNVNIIAGVDNAITTGADVNSDGIIPTYSSTGAAVAKYGERFADGYVQKNSCGGNYKVSPAMTIDASSAYLPDNTWFVSGLFHGMTFWDYFTRDLMITLTVKDNEITDVYSSPDYPQFHTSTNPSYAVAAWFDSSTEGYVSSEDSALIIKNLSIKNRPLKILAVNCDGLDIKLKMPLVPIIKAGEEIKIPFTGEIPKVSNSRVTVTVSYTTYGSVTPVGERSIAFTILNGEIPECEGGTVSAKPETPLDRLLPAAVLQLLKGTGLYNFFSMFYSIIYYALNSVKLTVR